MRMKMALTPESSQQTFQPSRLEKDAGASSIRRSLRAPELHITTTLKLHTEVPSSCMADLFDRNDKREKQSLLARIVDGT